MLLAVPIYIGSVIGLSFLIASYFDMPERAGQVLVFTSIPLFMLSGAAWPHAAMCPALAAIHCQYISFQLRAIQLFIQLNQMGVKILSCISKINLFVRIW